MFSLERVQVQRGKEGGKNKNGVLDFAVWGYGRSSSIWLNGVELL